MLDYITTSQCRRKFLVAYFGETLPEKNPNCCDNDGAILPEKKGEREIATDVLPWGKIIQKIFKNVEKD